MTPPDMASWNLDTSCSSDASHSPSPQSQPHKRYRIDLLVHHEDLPILPGNLGEFSLLGFGLRDHPNAIFAIGPVKKAFESHVHRHFENLANELSCDPPIARHSLTSPAASS